MGMGMAFCLTISATINVIGVAIYYSAGRINNTRLLGSQTRKFLLEFWFLLYHHFYVWAARFSVLQNHETIRHVKGRYTEHKTKT